MVLDMLVARAALGHADPVAHATAKPWTWTVQPVMPGWVLSGCWSIEAPRSLEILRCQSASVDSTGLNMFQLVKVAWEVQPSRNVIMIDLELWEEELRESSRFTAKVMKAIGHPHQKFGNQYIKSMEYLQNSYFNYFNFGQLTI